MDHSAALPDYEAPDVLVVAEPGRQRALAHELRAKIVMLLREKALSTNQLASELGLPKGTVGHHMKVLEQAGLVRVVRRRRVRAVTEKFYGRTARLFVLKGEDEQPVDPALAQVILRLAADELGSGAHDETTTQALLKARLSTADARRFRRRLERLVDDVRAADSPDGRPYGLVTGLYRTSLG
ncbi:MAG TPA: ArsR family transcriptional regulator [Gaiellaceae bacterium]|nr:ArsR family transcriptional regulator [Gaiellaceae bacterium]